MGNLRILTAGESHGKGLIGIIDGIPAGLRIDREKIDYQLKRRQKGYGRGGRMKIEKDRVEILSGLRSGTTTGSPIAIFIENKDWANWQEIMGVWKSRTDLPVKIPRPGHADLAGAFKYNHHDLRNVLERASARETAMRVAAGSVIRQLLEIFGIWIGSHVIGIHEVQTDKTFRKLCQESTEKIIENIKEKHRAAEASELRCSDPEVEEKMKKKILQAEKEGDSVGGMFELAALNVPIGLGTYTFWDKRLDAIISGDVMSIPGIKAVEIGFGVESSHHFGSEIHDPILPGKSAIPQRSSNRAGGIEGGISNGEPIIVRAAMKPIPTLKKPLPSVNLETGEPVHAHKERSDVCAVPAASVVGEAMLAISLGKAFCEKFGGDSLEQMQRHYDGDKSAISG